MTSLVYIKYWWLKLTQNLFIKHGINPHIKSTKAIVTAHLKHDLAKLKTSSSHLQDLGVTQLYSFYNFRKIILFPAFLTLKFV